MPYGPFSVPHVLLGFAVLVLYWTPLISRKGGERHRRVGRWFMLSLPVVVASVVPIILFDQARHEPAAFVQILYLGLCVGTVDFVGWNAIRRKADLAAFRSRHFGVLGFLMLSSGSALLTIGIAEGKVLPAVFSTIGISYGALMLKFYFMRAEVQPRWWLAWHAGSMSFLFSAVHGSVLAVLWKSAFGPGSGDSVQVATQSLALVVAVLLFVFMARRHGIALRFRAVQQSPVPVMHPL